METFLILRIHTGHHELVKKSHDSIVEHIVNGINSNSQPRKINHKTIGDFKYYLFAEYVNETRSKWSEFLPDELKEDIKFDIDSLNLILFASYEHALFATCGGKSFQNIIKYTDDKFGISMISKMLDEEKDTILSIDTRGITGNTAKSSQQYKKELKLIDFAKFGTIPTSLLFVLNAESSKLYFSHLTLKKGEKVKIEAGRGLKVKKHMDFGLLHQTFSSFETIYSLEEKEYLSSYEKLKNDAFINGTLYPVLIQKLFDYASNLDTSAPIYHNESFDFIHPSKHLEFITSDRFVLKEKIDDKHVEFEEVYDYSEIVDSVLLYVIGKTGKNDRFEFMKMLQGIRILSYKNGKNNFETESPFIYFINVEIPIRDGHYIYLDNGWYLLKDNFLKELNSSLVSLLKSKTLPNGILNLGWNKDLVSKESKEKDYNLKYKGLEGYLVFDTFTPQGIELCDILYYTASDVYFIHVKYGFNESIRSLASQVTISAHRLKTDRDSGKYDFITKLYSTANVTSITLDTFKDIINLKRINFVFAFTSGFKNDFRIEDNIDKMKSNIAKYSLIDCNSKMIEIDYNIYFKQIMHEDEK